MRLSLLVLGWFLLVSLAWAQPMESTPEEQEALMCVSTNKLVRLRELSKVLIEKFPDRIGSYYFMGYSLHRSEGDLPRAHFYLQKGLKIFEDKYGKVPPQDSPWGWWERNIEELLEVAGEMDQYQEQIELLDKLQAKVQALLHRTLPFYEARYAWPLMKLKRETEARRRLANAADGSDEATRTTYLNTLGALEMEYGHPQASYLAFTELLRDVKSHNWSNSATYLRNAGEAAATVARFDEAERFYLEATDYFDPTSFSNPWWDLATLYLGQARFPEAVSALKKSHLWVYNSQPFLAQQSLAAGQQLSCEVLLQLGMTEKALSIAEAIVDRPDRKGGDSVQRDQWEAANLLVYREALLARRYACQEEMCWTSGRAWWKLLWEQRRLGWNAYLAGERVAASLIEHGRLLTSLRWGYAPGTIIVPNYLRPELVTLYGPGTTLAALAEIAKAPFEGIEVEQPYLDSIEAEALVRSGRRDQALKKIEQCQAKLPATEVLLGLRLIALAGQVKEQQGDTAGANKAYQQVLEKAPGLLRTLKISIPVEAVGGDSGPLAQAASAMFGSPRFRREAGAFHVQFSSSGDELKAVLLGLDNSVLATAAVKQGTKPDQGPMGLVADLHAKFFAAHIDLSQLDTNSLDGVVTGAVQSKQMENMFFPGMNRDDKK